MAGRCAARRRLVDGSCARRPYRLLGFRRSRYSQRRARYAGLPLHVGRAGWRRGWDHTQAVISKSIATRSRSRIMRYVVADDCGRVIDPLIVDGQVQGGVVQGVDGALLEEIVYNEVGQLLTGTLMDLLDTLGGRSTG